MDKSDHRQEFEREIIEQLAILRTQFAAIQVEVHNIAESLKSYTRVERFLLLERLVYGGIAVALVILITATLNKVVLAA